MAKRFRFVFVLLLGCMSCQSANAEPFTAELLVRLDRVGAPAVSPDGSLVAYSVRKTDMDAAKGRYDLWISTTAGGQPQQLTRHESADSDPAWSADGKAVYFLSSRSGSSQVWRIAPDGGEAVQVTDLPIDVGTFRLTPDDSGLVVSLKVYNGCDVLACTVDKTKAVKDSPTSGQAYTRLFMRHWDHWLDGRLSRLFFVPLRIGTASKGEPLILTGSVDANVPSNPWGGVEEYTISPDGETLFFTARLRNSEESWSTNFDIYSAPMNGDGPAVKLTKDNPAWDTQPNLSPDGSKMVWLAMSRPGFEADRFRIMMMDLHSGESRELAPGWDHSPASVSFSADGKALYANAQDLGSRTLWRLDLGSGAMDKVAGGGTINAFDAGSETIVFARDTLQSPNELFVLEPTGERQLTDFSGPQLKGVEMADAEQFSFTGAHGDTVYGYVMKPAGYEEGKQYPVAFLIHGGPQGSFGDHFHYRWNPQTYAGQGFAAVFIDFHGSTGYGQKFTDSISGDWGGAPLLDLQLGLAAAREKFDFLDGERACALGASYGGYMINWIAGNWPDGFNCLVNHDGVFDARMMFYATEELWFPEWENGGPHFLNQEGYEKYNPVNYVQNWKTPMLVIHGELDYRVPVTQGIAAFTALQRRGIAGKFLYYPDENHWVLNPHNSVEWHNTVNSWLHQYLGNGQEREMK